MWTESQETRSPRHVITIMYWDRSGSGSLNKWKNKWTDDDSLGIESLTDREGLIATQPLIRLCVPGSVITMWNIPPYVLHLIDKESKLYHPMVASTSLAGVILQSNTDSSYWWRGAGVVTFWLTKRMHTSIVWLLNATFPKICLRATLVILITCVTSIVHWIHRYYLSLSNTIQESTEVPDEV